MAPRRGPRKLPACLAVRGRREARPQAFPPFEEARLHNRRRDTENLGDLPARELVAVAKEEGLPLRLRQGGERLRERPPLLLPDEVRERARGRIPEVGRRGKGGDAAPACAEQVQAVIPRHPVEPGPETLRRLARFDRAPERLL